MDKELAKQLLASIKRDAQTLHDLAELTGNDAPTQHDLAELTELTDAELTDATAELTTSAAELQRGGAHLLDGIDKATAALRGLFAEHPDRVGAEKAIDELEKRSHQVGETLKALPT